MSDADVDRHMTEKMTNEELANFLLGGAIVLTDEYSLSEMEEIEGKLIEAARRLRALKDTT